MAKRRFERYYYTNLKASIDGFDADVIDISFGGLLIDSSEFTKNSIYTIHIKIYEKKQIVNFIILNGCVVRVQDGTSAFEFVGFNWAITKLLLTFIMNKWKSDIKWKFAGLLNWIKK